MDRSAVVTANAETVAVTPSGIQEAINAETGKQQMKSYPFILHAVQYFLCTISILIIGLAIKLLGQLLKTNLCIGILYSSLCRNFSK